MARPKLPINSGQVERLATLGCTEDEIAFIVGCSRDVITRRFKAEVQKGRSNAKCRLRRWQLRAAKGGNATLLIWLGKQMLGQREPPTAQQNEAEVIEQRIKQAVADLAKKLANTK